MIDVHCHILPGVDDGPETFDESLEMCRIAAADGIKTIVATPHFRPGVNEFSSARIGALIEELSVRIREKGLDITVLPGADVAVTPELFTYVRNEECLTINKGGRYVLVEFPFSLVPPNWEEFLARLRRSGIVPIITHPERNTWFLNHREAVFSAVTKGVMVQVTAMSVTGEFGNDAKEFCRFLMEHNLAHVIASDAHSASHRPPVLSEAVMHASEIIGAEMAKALVTTIPAAIVQNKPVTLPPAIEYVKRKKTWLKRVASR